MSNRYDKLDSGIVDGCAFILELENRDQDTILFDGDLRAQDVAVLAEYFGLEVVPKAATPTETLETELKRILHYPGCWDTVAYPSILCAVREVFDCAECDQ